MNTYSFKCTVASTGAFSITNYSTTQLTVRYYNATRIGYTLINPDVNDVTANNTIVCVIVPTDLPNDYIFIAGIIGDRYVCLYGDPNHRSPLLKVINKSLETTFDACCMVSDMDCDRISTADGSIITSLGAVPPDYTDDLHGYADVIVNPNGVHVDITGYNIDNTLLHSIITNAASYKCRKADISVTPPEMYFTESSNDQNILHVPMESTTGTVITGGSQSVQIPSSALLEVAQPKAPADVTIKYSGTSVPVVSNTPASRSRKKVT